MAQVNPTIVYYAYISSVWTVLRDRGQTSGSWGMPDNDPVTRLAKIGELSITLNNSGGWYSPGGASALSGWKKGIPAKMVITYDGIPQTFYYKINNIKINPDKSRQSVDLTLVDWMADASEYPIINPALLQNSRANTGISTLLTSMPVQPQSTSLQTGDNIFPTQFDSVRDNTKAYTEFAKLSLSELGQIYLKRDGTLVFESSSYRNGTRSLKSIPNAKADSGYVLREDGGYRLREDGGKVIRDETSVMYSNNNQFGIDITYGDKIINRWTTNAYPKKQDTSPVQIYETETPIYLSANETKTFRGFFTNPVGNNKINAIPPTQDSYTKSVLQFESDNENGAVEDDIATNTWTNSGIALVSNVKKFGNRSGYFDGSAAYIYSADKDFWDLGSSDFTIKWWEYRIDAASGGVVTARDYSASFSPFVLGKSDGTNSKVYLTSNGSSYDIANGKTFGAISTNTWVHYEIDRSGSNFYMFKNGTLTDSWTSASALFASSSVMSLGRQSTNYINACIDDFVFRKGVAEHTASFTPSTSVFQALGTYGRMWTLVDLTGTDLSDYLTISPVYGTEGATFTITNTGTTPGYVYLSTLGYGIYSNSSLEDTQTDTSSIASYGYYNQNLQQQYQQTLYNGVLEGKKNLELYKQPKTDLNSITLHANSSPANMQAFLYVDVGDLVHVRQSDNGIDGYYYVVGVDFTINGFIIQYTWKLKQQFEIGAGLSGMAIEFAGDDTSYMDFGYIPAVSNATTYNRGFSLWFYADTAPTVGPLRVLFAITNSDSTGGLYIYQVSHATNKVLRFFSTYTSINGSWDTPTTSYSTGAWTNLFIAFNNSTVSAAPLIYINGVLQTLTNSSVPSGTTQSDVGAVVKLGNRYSTESYSPDGKEKDFRIYNMDNVPALTPAALALALYNEGAYGSGYLTGLAFQSPVVRTEDYSTYTNLTLTSSTKMLDAFGGYVGTANGSPISRVP